MLKLFSNLFFTDNSGIALTYEQEDGIIHDIEMLNFKKMEIILFAFIIVEILFISLNDIPNLMNIGIKTNWTDKRFFILHLLLLTVSLTGIIIIRKLIQNYSHKTKLEKKHKLVIPSLTMIILILVSIINGLDQLTLLNVSSVFIANILIFSSTMLIEFRVALLVYSMPFFTYITSLLTFQRNTVALATNIINGMIFFFGVITISKTFYDNQYSLISKNIELQQINEKLNYMSNHDPLTGLSNRRNFETKAKQKMDSTDNNLNTAALILMDIDYFKHINDQFGHPTGDAVLMEISNILLKNINSNDLVTRWGGEEFLIFSPQMSIEDAHELANKIRIAIDKNVFLAGKLSIHVTASFGISQLKGSFSDNFSVSYKLADKSLYQAKNRGRNQVVIATPAE